MRISPLTVVLLYKEAGMWDGIKQVASGIGTGLKGFGQDFGGNALSNVIAPALQGHDPENPIDPQHSQIADTGASMRADASNSYADAGKQISSGAGNIASGIGNAADSALSMLPW